MKITLSQLRNYIFVLTLMLLSGGIGWGLGQRNITVKNFQKKDLIGIINQAKPPDKQNIDFSLFWDVWNRLEKNFLFSENIDEKKMVYGAIAGMTAALDDPYTAFFPPQENQTSKENLNGSFEGIGIQLGYKKLNGVNQLAVISPLTGMPAEKAGVKAGEYILKIIDKDKGINKETGGMSLMEAVELIRGERDTKVTLALYAEGSEKPRDVEILRETIVVPSVEVKFGQLNDKSVWEEKDEGKIAWLKLSRFGGLTDSQWDEAVDAIKNKTGLKGVVLDLRNNPGGYLDGAVNLTSEFLDKGKVVVKQEQTNQTDEILRTKRAGRLTKIPLAVLINEGSASSSEILAGALRDHKRAKLVGEKSFGKGTIQEAEDLKNGAGLHITIARWLTPNGDWVHEKGITPDVEVKLDEEKPEEDNQLSKAVEILNQ